MKYHFLTFVPRTKKEEWMMMVVNRCRFLNDTNRWSIKTDLIQKLYSTIFMKLGQVFITIIHVVSSLFKLCRQYRLSYTFPVFIFWMLQDPLNSTQHRRMNESSDMTSFRYCFRKRPQCLSFNQMSFNQRIQIKNMGFFCCKLALGDDCFVVVYTTENNEHRVDFRK